MNFNVAVQTSVPDWVRGRALAFYLLAFQGVLAFDGALWGWLAGVIGTPECFAVAGVGLIAGLILIRFFPLVIDETIDLRPSTHWPEAHAGLHADLDDGPVLVTIEYLVAPENFRPFSAGDASASRAPLAGWSQTVATIPGCAATQKDSSNCSGWIPGVNISRQHERTTMADKELEALALETASRSGASKGDSLFWTRRVRHSGAHQ